MDFGGVVWEGMRETRLCEGFRDEGDVAVLVAS